VAFKCRGRAVFHCDHFRAGRGAGVKPSVLSASACGSCAGITRQQPASECHVPFRTSKASQDISPTLNPKGTPPPRFSEAGCASRPTWGRPVISTARPGRGSFAHGAAGGGGSCTHQLGFEGHAALSAV
jgi:hypothetical protein